MRGYQKEVSLAQALLEPLIQAGALLEAPVVLSSSPLSEEDFSVVVDLFCEPNPDFPDLELCCLMAHVPLTDSLGFYFDLYQAWSRQVGFDLAVGTEFRVAPARESGGLWVSYGFDAGTASGLLTLRAARRR